MTEKESFELLKHAAPMHIPQVITPIIKSCQNCADYIACYGLNECKKDKGKNCPEWQLDFMEYQNLVRENNDRIQAK